MVFGKKRTTFCSSFLIQDIGNRLFRRLIKRYLANSKLNKFYKYLVTNLSKSSSLLTMMPLSLIKPVVYKFK